MRLKRDSKAAKAFLAQARRDCGLYPPMTIVTDKAPTYPAIIKTMGDHAYSNLPVEHINQKWCNNRIESDHAALKRITNPGKGFQSMRSAKATLQGVEAMRTIKRGHLFEKPKNAAAEVRLLESLFPFAA